MSTMRHIGTNANYDLLRFLNQKRDSCLDPQQATTRTRPISKGWRNTMKRWLTSAFAAFTLMAVVTPTFAKEVKQITFKLTPQAKFLSCLSVAGGSTPTATVTVKRGPLHDTLTLKAQNLKPNLAFDLFTIQNT